MSSRPAPLIGSLWFARGDRFLDLFGVPLGCRA